LKFNTLEQQFTQLISAWHLAMDKKQISNFSVKIIFYLAIGNPP